MNEPEAPPPDTPTLPPAAADPADHPVVAAAPEPEAAAGCEPPPPTAPADTASAVAGGDCTPVAQPGPEAEGAPGAPHTPAEQAAARIEELSPEACAAQLAARFPAVFSAGAPKPLKLRIQADIQQRAPGLFTRRTLSVFLHRHTTGNAYLRALIASPSRFDLDGAAAGEVSAEHRDAAQAELDRRRAIRDVRIAAEKAARRQPRPEATAGAPATPGAADAPRHDRRPAPPRPARAPRPDAAQPDAARPDRPPRRERPDGPDRPPQAAHGSRPGGQRQDRAHPRPGSGEEAPRPLREGADLRAHDRRPPQAARDAEGRLPAAQRPVQRSPVDAAPERIETDPARRSALALARAWSATTLSRANFLALKGLSEADLDAALALAKAEGLAGPAAPPARFEPNPRRPRH